MDGAGLKFFIRIDMVLKKQLPRFVIKMHVAFCSHCSLLLPVSDVLFVLISSHLQSKAK